MQSFRVPLTWPPLTPACHVADLSAQTEETALRRSLSSRLRLELTGFPTCPSTPPGPSSGCAVVFSVTSPQSALVCYSFSDFLVSSDLGSFEDVGHVFCGFSLNLP